MSVDQIQKVLQPEFSPEQRLSFDAYVRDFIACSFLIREGDQYRFSHLSFMEYLVAKHLMKEIQSDTPDILQRCKLTPAVRSFLLELQPSLDDDWRKVLRSWVDRTKKKDAKVGAYLGGNGITILKYLKEDLRQADFRGAVLCDADLTNARLEGAKFTHSNLERVDMTGAESRECRFPKR